MTYSEETLHDPAGSDSAPANAPPRVLLILVAVILLGIVARCYRISDPLLERYGWRQYDTAAIARNFSEGSMNILYPQVDWRGNSPGYVEAEFQVYTYLVAGLYRLFGVHEWLGRAVNIAVYALSSLVLFGFLRRLFDDSDALLGVFFFSVIPLSFVYTRTFQPDAMMMMGMLVGVHYFWRWTTESRAWLLMMSALGILLAGLIKPTALFIGAPLLYLAHRRFQWKLFRQYALWIYAVAILFPIFLWYQHAAGLWTQYGNSFHGMYFQLKNPGFMDRYWLVLVAKLGLRVAGLITTPAGLILLVTGLLAPPRNRNYMLHWWLAGFVISVLIAPRGYMEHDYYSVPLIFICVAWMVMGLRVIRGWRRVPPHLYRPVLGVTILLIIAGSSWMLSRQLRIWPESHKRVEFGRHVNRLTEPGAMVVFVKPRIYPWIPERYQHRTAFGERLPCDPIDFYLSSRKGWNIDEIQATPEFIAALQRRGARYLATFYPDVFRNRPELRNALNQDYKALEVTPDWEIYGLDPDITVRKQANHIAP